MPFMKNGRKKDDQSRTCCRDLQREAWGWVHRRLPCLSLNTGHYPHKSPGPSPWVLESISRGFQVTCVITYTCLYLLSDDPAVLSSTQITLIPLPQSQQNLCLWQNAVLATVHGVSKHSCVDILSRTVTADSLQHHGLQPARLLYPWNFPSKNTGVGRHALLQGILPMSMHWQSYSLPLNHLGSPTQLMSTA